MKHLKLSWTTRTSTPIRVNRLTYSLRVSFFYWTMTFSAAMVFGCFCLTVQWETNSSRSSFQKLMEWSSSLLNEVMVAPFSVKTNNFNFTAPRLDERSLVVVSMMVLRRVIFLPSMNLVWGRVLLSMGVQRFTAARAVSRRTATSSVWVIERLLASFMIVC